AQTVFTQSGHLDQLVKKLEDLRQKNPLNRAVVERLVTIYAKDNRLSEASRVLDATRAAVAGEADLLYTLSHLYTQIQQKQTAEEIMKEVVRLDPSHAGA